MSTVYIQQKDNNNIQPNEDQKQRRKLSQYSQENKLLASQYSRGEKSEKRIQTKIYKKKCNEIN
jgi:hypothetical protein